MTPKFIDIEDFVGDVRIPVNTNGYDEDYYDEIIARREKDLLRDVLNDKLYSDLIADLDGNNVPQTQSFIDLIDGKTYVDNAGQTVIYEGFSPMLKYMIYEYIVNDEFVQQNTVGSSISAFENSVSVTRSDLNKSKNQRFNKGITFYNDIVRFIDTHYEDYFPDTNDYAFWQPVRKKKKGVITRKTYNNEYYRNKIY